MHNRYHWGMGVAYLTYLFYFNSKNIYDIHNTVSFAWKKQTYNGKNVAVGLRTFVWVVFYICSGGCATGIFWSSILS